VLEVLERFCAGKTELVCGYAGKEDQDYESFSNWLGDKTPEKSLLVHVDTKEFKKTIFEGDLAALTEEQVASFIEEATKVEEAKEAKEEAKEEPAPVEAAVEEAVPTEAPAATTE
jgi:hypothetical protein